MSRWATYYPKPYEQWRKDFARLFPWQSSRAALCGPLVVSLVFVCAVPRSYSKTEREAALRGMVHCKVGDTDNCAKSVLDALTKSGVWQDDKQVDELHVVKRYGATDEIHIKIEKKRVMEPTHSSAVIASMSG